jgi:hypothetical protein
MTGPCQVLLWDDREIDAIDASKDYEAPGPSSAGDNCRCLAGACNKARIGLNQAQRRGMSADFQLNDAKRTKFERSMKAAVKELFAKEQAQDEQDEQDGAASTVGRRMRLYDEEYDGHGAGI